MRGFPVDRYRSTATITSKGLAFESNSFQRNHGIFEEWTFAATSEGCLLTSHSPLFDDAGWSTDYDLARSPRKFIKCSRGKSPIPIQVEIKRSGGSGGAFDYDLGCERRGKWDLARVPPPTDDARFASHQFGPL